MSKNVGMIDRVVRGIVGLVLLGFALFGGYWWGWIGVIALATAAFGYCPAYRLVGLNSCPIAPKQA